MFVTRHLASALCAAVVLQLAAGPGFAARQEVSSPRSPAPLGADYRIGPEDVLSIDVFGLDDLDFKVRVLPDGTISLPLLGTLRLGGMTPKEAEAEVARQLVERRLIKQPQVSILVEEFVSQSVTVLGAVEAPGDYPLVGPTSLLDLIAAAGGLSAGVGPGQEIVIQRITEGTTRVNLRVRVEQLLAEGQVAVQLDPKPGDIVMVPHPQELQVFVTGAVQTPGAVAYDSGAGITVLQAITAAGGPTERAHRSKVHVIRLTPEGVQQRFDVDVKKIQKGKEPDFPLQRGDTVVVGEWFF